MDPLTDAYPYYTPYQYAGCEPIANTDLDGLEPVPANVAAAPGAMIGNVTVTNIPKVASQGVNLAGSVTSASLNFASQYLSGASGNFGINASQAALYAPPPRKETPTFSQGVKKNFGPPAPKTDEYYLSQIRKETLERLSSGGSDGFPILGNLLRAGRMELHGFHREAGSALKDAGVEAALTYAGGPVLKYLGTGGRTFSQYKVYYWSTRTKPPLQPLINPQTGQVWKQYIELRHRFIPQRATWAPNWLKNNSLNLKAVTSLKHAQIDPYRARFAPTWVKETYNLKWQ